MINREVERVREAIRCLQDAIRNTFISIGDITPTPKPKYKVTAHFKNFHIEGVFEAEDADSARYALLWSITPQELNRPLSFTTQRMEKVPPGESDPRD